MRVGPGRLAVGWQIYRRPNLDPKYRQHSQRCVTQSDTDVAFYLDASALVKLVVSESETDALWSWLAEEPREPIGCDLARTELLRAVRRVAPDRVVQARAVLEAVTLVEVTTAIFEEAGRLTPSTLRTLDAVHIAAALDLGDDLEGLVTYDERLAAAAEANGIAVTSPS